MTYKYACALDDLLFEVRDMDVEYFPADPWNKTKLDQFDPHKIWNHFIKVEEKISARYGLSEHDYSLIELKLFEDDFIKEHEPPPKSNDSGQEVLGRSFYYITFKGLEFYLDGGYKKQRWRKNVGHYFKAISNVFITCGAIATIFIAFIEWKKYSDTKTNQNQFHFHQSINPINPLQGISTFQDSTQPLLQAR